ncbi:MAG: isopeptide-forming domain-containing fimbrial protein, partial [Alcanivoracaceae bacterium]|nr:isopeptide-forming domain-containing fimbrial protein [Alcanivoracaceae bacterium]
MNTCENTVLHVKFSSVLVLFLFLFCQMVFSQTPLVSPIANQSAFPGEAFCISAPLENSGSPGFGPYLQVIVPVGLTFNSSSLFGVTVNTINEGVFPAAPGNQLIDSIISQSVTATPGSSLYLLQPPIGSVVTGGPVLDIEICFTIDVASPVNVPLNVSITPVYEFGDTATGINGPIIGSAVAFNVTPILVVFTKTNNAPENERPPGTSWPVTYILTADVASANTINNITIADVLPANFVLDVVSVNVVGGVGCMTTTGAIIQVSCTSVTGTGSSDIVVSYSGYFADILDETTCSTSTETNNASFDGIFLGVPIPTLADDNTIQVEHLSIQKSAAPSLNVVPGDVVTFSLAIQVTDFGTANDLQLADILPDGYTFIPGSEVSNFGAITAMVTDNIPVNGATTLDFNITAITANISAGTALSLSYQASVDANYFSGNPVLANDDLNNSITATYSLTAGASGCVDNSAASVEIAPVSITKEILTMGPYQPGDIVTYRLSLSVPSGDTNSVVFNDFLPLPVFVATSVDTGNFGPGFDIRLSPTDTLALTPSSITSDAPTNSLTINWPDITTASPQVLSVDIDIAVTSDPFADNLSLTNLLLVNTENTAPIQTTDITPVVIQVRAPELMITKGILLTDQGTISPLPSILPVDGNVIDVDAGDLITYQVTVENTGGAVAHNVTITDTGAMGLGTCNIVSVQDGAGTMLASSGTLASGVILTNPLAVNDGTIGAPYSTDTAILIYSCTIAISVEPNSVITNTAAVTFASTDGSTVFPTLTDDAIVTVKEPEIDKSILSITPDVDSNGTTVTIGEIIEYQVELTIQEGTTNLSSLVDVLDTGLIFQSFDQVTPSAGLSTSHTGGFAGVLADATGLGTATATFPFDTITNTNTNNGVDETITISYTVIVSDIPSNSNGGNRNNRARFNYSGDFIQDRAPNVTIREPVLTIDKTVTPTSADAGDTVTYTVVVTNTGTSPAFDVAISDNLTNAFLNLTSGSVTTTSGVITTGNTGGDTTILIDVPSIAVSSMVTVTFDVVLDAATPSGSNLINTAQAAFSSLTGGGRIYTPVTDTATVNVVAAVVTKSTLPLTSTEQTAGTSNQGNPALVDLTIGEEVTFEIVATLAEGVSPSVIITDTLPNNATGSMDVVSASVISVGTNLTPTIPAPMANISPTNVVSFDFGSVSNTADGVVNSDDQIVIQVTAIVLDAGVNSGLEILTNNVLVQYNTGLDASDSADIEVVEPRLTINKSSPTTTADAGDTITFTLAIANTTAENSSANAFEVNLIDTIPADYTYVGSSLSQSSGPAADVGTLIEVGGVIQASWSQFDLGDTAVITYQVTLDNTVAPEQNITNTANIDWTSLPGVSPDERTGMDSEGHTVTVTAPGLDKVVFSTSQASSGTSINGPEDDLIIGEQVTYRFTITLPEGTSLAATAVDQLPTVSTIMNVVSSQVISIGSQLTVPGIMVSQAGIVSNTDADIYNDNVAWNLGNVFNMPDGINNTDDQIVFEVVAILVDEAVNQNGGNDIINTATFNTGGNTSTGTALIDIIEPEINVTKATVPASITADAGDVLDYRITIAHIPASNADAFNFTVTDVLPTPGTNWINDTTVSSTCGAVVTNSTAAPTIVFTFPSLALASTSCTIDYQVQVDIGVNPNVTYQNTVTTTFTSTAVINPETRTDTDMDSTSFITPDPAIVKVSASSSLLDTGDNVGDMLLADLAIGEEIDFTLTVIFPEGTTTNAIVVDSLPLAVSGGIMEVVSATVDSIGANLLSSLPGTPVVSNVDMDAF